jgi:hypothetical protein
LSQAKATWKRLRAAAQRATFMGVPAARRQSEHAFIGGQERASGAIISPCDHHTLFWLSCQSLLHGRRPGQGGHKCQACSLAGGGPGKTKTSLTLFDPSAAENLLDRTLVCEPNVFSRVRPVCSKLGNQGMSSSAKALTTDDPTLGAIPNSSGDEETALPSL